MSFSGNLEHLPIVDVMQLLETTRKTGTLCVKNNGTEYKFGFEDGYIVSVKHPDTGWSFCQVLLLKNFTDKDGAERIYEDCKARNKVISAYLTENKKINMQTLQKLLANFVEFTLVDILTWQKGSFELSVDSVEVSEEFIYFSEATSQKFYLSTQNTLMEALRVFDEWMRDNLLNHGLFEHKTIPIEETSDVIDENILGLSDVDRLERKIPKVFTGIREMDYSENHMKKVKDGFTSFKKEEQLKITEFLTRLDKEKKAQAKIGFAVILYSDDDFTVHAITTICKNLGIFIFATDSEENIDLIINQTTSKSLVPYLFVDLSGKMVSSNFSNINIIVFLIGMTPNLCLNNILPNALLFSPSLTQPILLTPWTFTKPYTPIWKS